MNIPSKLRSFLKSRLEFDIVLMLPHNFAELGLTEDFQAGYAHNAITGENLTNVGQGAFSPDWIVFAKNYYDDPFFIDLKEEDRGFPVYFAFHGAGAWKPIGIAPSLDDFSDLLSGIRKIEGENAKIIEFIKRRTAAENRFWSEVIEEIRGIELEDLDEDEDEDVPGFDSSQLVNGTLFITDLGPNKMKVVNFLKQELDLTPAEALKASKKMSILIGKGNLLQLKYKMTKIEALGATVLFEPDAK